MSMHRIHKTQGFRIIGSKGTNEDQYRCSCGEFWWVSDSAGIEGMYRHKIDVLWEERNV